MAAMSVRDAAEADVSVHEVDFAPREVHIERRPDGTLILRSPINFSAPSWSAIDLLSIWALKAPDRTFLAQRSSDGQWQRVSYGEIWRRVQGVGQALIDLGAKPGDRLAILSGNSIEHAVVMFAAMAVGVVVAPTSPNYVLMPGGLTRLQDIITLLRPSFVFVQDTKVYAAARSIHELQTAVWISVDGGEGTLGLESLYDVSAGTLFANARNAVNMSSPAKILFTSGSTGLPKGVINTHRMMSSALGMGELLVKPRPEPVQVEWLPWHHTMGSNVILHGILKNGGTLYIDDGRPVPQLFHKTISNLKEISPTAMFNVPIGYTLLCDALEADEELQTSFFRRLERITYGGSAISGSTLERLYRLSQKATGRRVPVMSGYGTTETAPVISTTHWATDRPGEIGLPVPGLALKLVPLADSFEVRASGPNVTPGYLEQPDLTRQAFDEEGYYRVGDTVAFIDPGCPHLGLRFTGRVSENFKLANGTWVVAGNLRAALLSATQGVLQDLVVAGENRENCAVLAWLNPGVAKTYAAGGDLLLDTGIREFLRDRLKHHNAKVGSSERIGAIALLDEPPSLAAGEITDKAHVNQRAVLSRRAHKVEELYSSSPPHHVLIICEEFWS